MANLATSAYNRDDMEKRKTDQIGVPASSGEFVAESRSRSFGEICSACKARTLALSHSRETMLILTSGIVSAKATHFVVQACAWK